MFEDAARQVLARHLRDHGAPGAVLARCIAMVLIWNSLACGSGELAAVLVACRRLPDAEAARRAEGQRWYDETFMPKFGPTALRGLLYTIVLMFATQGHRILGLPFDGRRIAVDCTAVDGRDVWLADLASGTLTRTTFNRALSSGDAQVQVTVEGGTEPVWGPTSRELFYRGGPTALPELIMASIQGELEPIVSSMRSLFGVVDMGTATPHSNYDSSPDARSFVMVRNNPSTRIMVVQNLPALVAKLRGGSAGAP